MARKAENIKENIKKIGETAKADEIFLVFHWDGKIIKLMSGEKEDRLTVAISAPNKIKGQFLASPIIPDGTSASMAKANWK